MSRRRRLAAGLVALAGLTWAAGGAAAAAVSPDPASAASWTVYHGSPRGTGVAGPVTAVDTRTRAWTSPTLDGELYGEPLVFAGRVYVATQNDTVYALSAATGAVAWSAHLGSPVPSTSLPCGDITPTVGITGTPVIDPARAEIFVVADEMVNGSPAHMLTGLATATGRTEMTQDVDPPGADPAALLQRTGLTLDDGRVVFGMGGNYGDCGSYRGRVIAAPETGGKGHVWVSVGNGSVDSPSQPFDHSDSVLELSPTMRLLQYFAPSDWASNNAQDLDLSTAPALLPDGQVIGAGKNRTVYLLDGAHLGGIGSEQASLGSACGDDIDGGVAVSGMTVYLPCQSGTIAVRAEQSPPALRLLWSSGTGGGPPILAAGLIWTIGQNGTLYGLNRATGTVRQQTSIGAVANHFPTPAVAGGLMLAAAARNVVAFAAPGPGAPAPAIQTAPPGTTAPSPPASQPQAAGGGLPAAALAGIAAGALIVIGFLGWLLWQRRTTGHN